MAPGARPDGLLVVREPKTSPHATAVRLAQEALGAAFGPGWDVRARLPLARDRGLRQSAYARARVPDAWLLDLTAGALEVRRRPPRRALGVHRRRRPPALSARRGPGPG